jgi:hypothetical protein
MFAKANKRKLKLRILLEGIAGCGKTFSALTLAQGMGKKIAVIDTEKGSASLYSDLFNFDVCELAPPYNPERFIDAIECAEKEGYDVIIIDSISAEWIGAGGCLSIQADLGGRYTDWAKVTPRHNKFVESILKSSSHIIATARAKSGYSADENGSKYKVTKVGLKTEQREGLDFEFTSVLRLNANHMFESIKDRTNLFDGKEGIIDSSHPKMLLDWLNRGVDEEKEAIDKINKCKKLSQLLKVWGDIPVHIKKRSAVVNCKDTMKAKLEVEETQEDIEQ